MSSPDDGYQDYPISVTERRAEKNRNASDWTPRDVLIDVLRRMDAGEIKPDALVVAYRKTTGPGITLSHYVASSPDLHVSLGLLQVAAMQMWSGRES